MIADDWEINKESKTIRYTGEINGNGVTIAQMYSYMKDLTRQDEHYFEQRKAHKKFIETLKQL